MKFPKYYLHVLNVSGNECDCGPSNFEDKFSIEQGIQLCLANKKLIYEEEGEFSLDLNTYEFTNEEDRNTAEKAITGTLEQIQDHHDAKSSDIFMRTGIYQTVQDENDAISKAKLYLKSLPSTE
jgi:hypothetical protein